MAHYELRKYTDGALRVCDTWTERLSTALDEDDPEDMPGTASDLYYFIDGWSHGEVEEYREHFGEPYEVVTL